MPENPTSQKNLPGYYTSMSSVTPVQLPDVPPAPVAAPASVAPPTPVSAPVSVSPPVPAPQKKTNSLKKLHPMFVGLAIALTISVIVAASLPQKSAAASNHASTETPEVASPVQSPVQDLLANGLNDWDTWLGKPHHSIDLPGSPAVKEGTEPPIIGLNKDPKGVFSLIKIGGKDTLKISGEISGGITTKEVFENYHFSTRFKWGDKLWPSQMRKNNNTVRDSGILVHCFGRPGSQYGYWMDSIEYQLRDWSVGDVHLLGTRGRVPLQRVKSKDGYKPPVFDINSRPRLTLGRVRRAPKVHEHKGWNTIDIYTIGTTTVFSINGKNTMVILRTEKNIHGDYYPLAKGKIQLQSDGAEIYYQDIKLRPIKSFPRNIQKIVDTAASDNGRDKSKIVRR